MGSVGGAGQPYHHVYTLVMARSVETEHMMTPGLRPQNRQEQAVGGYSGTGAHNLPVVFRVRLADKGHSQVVVVPVGLRCFLVVLELAPRTLMAYRRWVKTGH